MYLLGSVQAHIELQEGLAASQKEALEGLQESTCKMMSQQAEAAQHTADAARHIKEVRRNFFLENRLRLHFTAHCDFLASQEMNNSQKRESRVNFTFSWCHCLPDD